MVKEVGGGANRETDLRELAARAVGVFGTPEAARAAVLGATTAQALLEDSKPDYRFLRLGDSVRWFGISSIKLNAGGGASISMWAKVKGHGIPQGMVQAVLNHIDEVEFVMAATTTPEAGDFKGKVGKVTLDAEGVASVSVTLPAVQGEFNAGFLATLTFWELLRSWDQRIKPLEDDELPDELDAAVEAGEKFPSLIWRYKPVQQPLPLDGGDGEEGQES